MTRANCRRFLVRGVALTGIALLAVPFVGCRGGISKKPPVHLVLDMDFQGKFKAQAESHFSGWVNGMAMRESPAGTVARGSIHSGPLYAFGSAEGGWVTDNPLPASAEVFARGRERFVINCAPCHDRTGSGRGLVAKRWPVPVPSFYAETHQNMAAGRIVNAITNGFNTMPSYAHQVGWSDRWAIARYIEALQYRMKARKN